MKNWFLLAISIVVLSCSQPRAKLQTSSSDYRFVDISHVPWLDSAQKVYVSAYSNLFYLDGSEKLYYTVTLSLRNRSLTEDVYFTGVDYYNSSGELIRDYIPDSALWLQPLETVEYIIEQAEREGGAGANFVVTYVDAPDLMNPPIIESVMTGTISHFGFAFKCDGVPIRE